MKALQKKRGIGSVLLILLVALAVGFTACSNDTGGDDNGNNNNNGNTNGNGNGNGSGQTQVTEYVGKMIVMRHPSRPSGVGGMVDLTDAKFELHWVDQNGVFTGKVTTAESDAELSEIWSMRLTTPSNFKNLATVQGEGATAQWDNTFSVTSDEQRMVQVFHRREYPGGLPVSTSVLVPAVLPLRSVSIRETIKEYYEDDIFSDLSESGIEVWGEYWVNAYNENWEGRIIGDMTGHEKLNRDSAYRKDTFPLAMSTKKMIMPVGTISVVPKFTRSGNIITKAELELYGVITSELRGIGGVELSASGSGFEGSTTGPFIVNVDKFYSVSRVEFANMNWDDPVWAGPFLETSPDMTQAQWKTRLDTLKPELRVSYSWANGYGEANNPEPQTRKWEFFVRAEEEFRVNMLNPAKFVKNTVYSTGDIAFSGVRTGGTVRPTLTYWGERITGNMPVLLLTGIEVQKVNTVVPREPWGAPSGTLFPTDAGAQETAFRRMISKAYADAGNQVMGVYTGGGKEHKAPLGTLVNEVTGIWRDESGSGNGGVTYAPVFYQNSLTAAEKKEMVTMPPSGKIATRFPGGNVPVIMALRVDYKVRRGGQDLITISNNTDAGLQAALVSVRPTGKDTGIPTGPWVNPQFTTSGATQGAGSSTFTGTFWVTPDLVNSETGEAAFNFPIGINGNRSSQNAVIYAKTSGNTPHADVLVNTETGRVTGVKTDKITGALEMTAKIPNSVYAADTPEWEFTEWTGTATLTLKYPVTNIKTTAGTPIALVFASSTATDVSSSALEIKGGQGTSKTVADIVWELVDAGGTNLNNNTIVSSIAINTGVLKISLAATKTAADVTGLPANITLKAKIADATGSGTSTNTNGYTQEFVIPVSVAP